MIYCKVAFQHHDISETEPQPLLEIEALLDEPSNLLVASPSPSTTSPAASPKRRSFPLSMCSSTKLAEGFWHLMSMVPSLNRLLDDLVQVGRAKRRFGLQGVDSFWLREALTPPSTVTGYDYELLETLGDSLLK